VTGKYAEQAVAAVDAWRCMPNADTVNGVRVTGLPCMISSLERRMAR
jgi:hypothetical protein